MATHLVTGGAGFLGHTLADTLCAGGERVRILDIADPPKLREGVEFVRADVLDRSRLAAAMKGINVVHHNAALVPVTKAGPLFRKVNVDGTAAVLESAAEAGVEYFVYVSSSAVFGVPERCPITDDTPLKPAEDYGRSKLEGERLVQKAAGGHMACAIVRPRTIVGPGRLGIFRILYEWIQEGRKIYVLGSGNNRFQFVHVQDTADFIALLAARRSRGVFNIGAEKFGTLRDDLTALISHAGTRSRVVGTPASLAVPLLRILDRLGLSPLAPYHYLVYPRHFYFDLSRPRRELGWRPKYSNLETFIEAYDWFLAHPEGPDAGDNLAPHRKPARQGILRFLKRIS